MGTDARPAAGHSYLGDNAPLAISSHGLRWIRIFLLASLHNVLA